METDRPPTIANFAISAGALRQVLEGKSLSVQRGVELVTLRSDGDEVIIGCRHQGPKGRAEYRVWLAELALAWNLLCA